MQQEDSSQNINNFKVNLTYPRNDEYEFYTKLERINLDKECDKDLFKILIHTLIDILVNVGLLKVPSMQFLMMQILLALFVILK